MKAMFTCRYADIARVGKISAKNETTSELSEFQTQIKHTMQCVQVSVETECANIARVGHNGHIQSDGELPARKSEENLLQENKNKANLKSK